MTKTCPDCDATVLSTSHPNRMGTTPEMQKMYDEFYRTALINAIDSPAVAALALVFNAPSFGKSFSEQIVEVLAPRLAALAATPAVGGEREMIANRAREWAGNYKPHSDGWNTFICFAEWVESLPAQPDSPLRVTGASDIVDEAACLIWSELCPGLVMGDDDRPYYEAAAKAVLSLPASPLRGRDKTLEPFLNFARCIPDNVDDARGMAYAGFAVAMGTSASLSAGNFRALLFASPPEQPAAATPQQVQEACAQVAIRRAIREDGYYKDALDDDALSTTGKQEVLACIEARRSAARDIATAIRALIPAAADPDKEAK